MSEIFKNASGKISGYVYVLSSPNTDLIKIGCTAFPPAKRIKEINSALPYSQIGPWRLEDFWEVSNWFQIEKSLHFRFAAQRDFSVDGARELFRLAPQSVSLILQGLNPSDIVKRPVIERMFQDGKFVAYIVCLFIFSGLMHYLDIQGAWTFTIFTTTSGGRYFTINIGGHEVAFSNYPHGLIKPKIHALILDRLICDYPSITAWIENRGGSIKVAHYKRALPRSVIVEFSGEFSDAIQFLGLEGVRRALIAYWAEALVSLSERGGQSTYARSHNWNAVAEIRYHILRNIAPIEALASI